DERCDLRELLRFPAEVLERIRDNFAIGRGGNLQLTQHSTRFKDVALQTSTNDVETGHGFCIRRGARRWCRRRHLVRKISVEELLEERRAIADVAFTRAVVGNKESNAGVENQVQVTMEVHSIAAVPNN